MRSGHNWVGIFFIKVFHWKRKNLLLFYCFFWSIIVFFLPILCTRFLEKGSTDLHTIFRTDGIFFSSIPVARYRRFCQIERVSLSRTLNKKGLRHKAENFRECRQHIVSFFGHILIYNFFLKYFVKTYWTKIIKFVMTFRLTNKKGWPLYLGILRD